MSEVKNGQHHAGSTLPGSSRVQLTERELRWTDEFASEGVAIVRTTGPTPAERALPDGNDG
jgi:hypothetical protein